MADAYFLSQTDRDAIRELIRVESQRQRRTTGRQGVELDDSGAPEVYAARTPAGGIAALNENTTGTAAVDLADDVPGAAECAIYQVIPDGGVPKLVPIVGLTKTVYNLSMDAIDGDIWIPVMRDKGGSWLSTVGTAGTGGEDGGSIPTFSGAKVYRTVATEAFNSGDFLPFNAELFDTGGYHDNATNNTRLTVPTTGYYLVGAHIVWATNSDTTNEAFGFDITPNGGAPGQILYTFREGTTTSVTGVNIAASALALLTAGDYIEIQLLAQNGRFIHGQAPGRTHFWIQRLGT